MSVLKKILIAFFVVFSFTTSAQEYAEKIPKKAGLYSAILPGSGQVYTKKYWKVPVIYGGLITSAYYINESNDLYQLYKSTYLNRLDGDFTDNLNYSDSDLRTLTRTLQKKQRGISIAVHTHLYFKHC